MTALLKTHVKRKEVLSPGSIVSVNRTDLLISLLHHCMHADSRYYERENFYDNSNASYTLCTNLDKSGGNHESRIVCTQVIRIQFVPDLIRDLRFVNSQPLAVFARTIKGHELDLHLFVCDVFISIHCSCILENF